jgi:hypothetical protein
MPVPELYKQNIDQIFSAIRSCGESRQYIPALMLLYGLIDSLAWSTSNRSSRGVRQNFELWVNSWLMPHMHARGSDITATDLYAARCGVLHTLTADSDLSNNGHARRILYAHGVASASHLRKALDKEGSHNYVTIQLEDLSESVRLAVDDIFHAAEKNPELAALIRVVAKKHYTYR